MKKIKIFSATFIVLVAFVLFYSNGNANTASIGNIQPSGSSEPKSGLTFSWNAVLGAHSYDLTVDDDAGFTSPAVQRSGLTSTSYLQGSQIGDLVPLVGERTYFIKVVAKDNDGGFMDQGTGQFTTQQ